MRLFPPSLQWDHVLLSETLLYHQLPWLGAFAKKYVLPLNGIAVSSLGAIFYIIHNRVGTGTHLLCHSM